MAWFPRKPIVVPVDFSRPSFDALDAALEMVSEPRDVWVLHVMPTDIVGDRWSPRRDEARAELEARLRERGVHGVSCEVLYGDPGSEVARFAEERGAELVVMASRGRTGIPRLLLGSVAERVLRLAHCPVLIVRGSTP
ncbi:MAG: universal stress protein [Planctomycetes bacterium]|nr:universal stress protein [Planctomycetota bacterium]